MNPDEAGVACNYVLQHYPDDIIAYAILSTRTLLRNAIVSARTHLHMRVRPVQNRPCRKLTALGRRILNFFTSSWLGHFRPLGIRCNHEIRE